MFNMWMVVCRLPQRHCGGAFCVSVMCHCVYFRQYSVDGCVVHTDNRHICSLIITCRPNTMSCIVVWTAIEKDRPTYVNTSATESGDNDCAPRTLYLVGILRESAHTRSTASNVCWAAMHSIKVSRDLAAEYIYISCMRGVLSYA